MNEEIYADLQQREEKQAKEKKPRFQAFKYWADVVKWIINLVGIVVDSVKENPFPKKDDYTVI